MIAPSRLGLYNAAMIKHATQSLESYCASNGLRLTPPRMSAYRIVQGAKKPVTAYDVLELMGKTLKNPKPPTAYRALDFLVEHGFIHRIESLNAYVLCDVNHHHSGSQFMICDSCGKVEEVHLCSLPKGLQDKVDQEKFFLHHWNLELHGVCRKCGHENKASQD